MAKRIEGIVIPAVTPFAQDGAPDFAAMRQNYARWNETAVAGYMCLGTNGEFKALDDEESLEVIRTACACRAPGKILIAGVGRESLHGTLAMIRRLAAEQIGVDYISVLTPCYFAKAMTDEALVAYYTAVADNSPYPVLLYCAPGYANSVRVSAEALKILAAHPNISGIKDTSTDMMEAYMAAVGDRTDFQVIAGSLRNFLSCLDLGGTAGVVSSANYFPDQCVRFFDLYQNGTREEALSYLSRLQALIDATGGPYSVAGVKCAMNLMGYQGGVPRLPVRPVSAAAADAMKAAIENAGVREGAFD